MRELFAPYSARYYRHDVQGMRAIGALLILIYHIWVNKVSGGVDVFFVVSGFLMTGLLLREFAREGKVKVFHFWGRIIKRIAPAAYLVLLATLVLGYFFLPPVFWRSSVNDLLFSAAHLQNIQLLRYSVDYLASEAPASPLQQFWALSMQVQFYAILPLLLLPALYFCRRQRSLKPLFMTFGAMLLVSFLYSVVVTQVRPNPSYFDTGARLWEFLAGALLAVALPFFRLPAAAAARLSLLGLLLLFATGIVVPNAIKFPGYIAALPVLAALLLLAAGAQQRTPTLNRLLGNRYLVALGNMSFTVYLWHWPLLIFAQYHYATTNLSLAQGLLVIVAAVLLSWITTKIIERPLRRLPKTSLWPSYAVGVLFFLPTVVPALSARIYAVQLHDVWEEQQSGAPERFFAGDQISLQDNAKGVTLEQFAAVGSNKAVAIQECLEGRVCEAGDPQSERVLALIGGSHAAQWEPAFALMGERYGFKVVSMVQMSCAIGYLEFMDEDCREYNETIVERLQDLQPDFIVTNSTRVDRHGSSEQVEYVPQAYVQKWQEIAELGVPMLGIRDNPWFKLIPSVCVWQDLESPATCARERNELYLTENPVTIYQGEIPNFHSVDFMDLMCTDSHCPAVFNNQLMYFDTHHLTRTYVEYIAPAMLRAMHKQVPNFSAQLVNGETKGKSQKKE